ncbi:YceG-like family protein [Paraliobacillus sp. PM-2]|uniref:endolytic transglycosylase MltG n=1 Tax=Paraliobacillus sp. PM-2 TaxID=1462524 RepID=UPI00061BBBF9|nr:endolytic transglycosylase MltG [Paraliobacillus sp. PM-2]CQR46850.1 YceG-like family protein [Paraliobacillus sp. PM-2]
MKQILRSFAAGLLTATLILSVIYLIEKNETSQNKENTLTTNQMKQALETQGYIISADSDVTQKEDEHYETEKESDKLNEPVVEENNQNSEPEEVRIFTLTIEPGMTISEVAEKLVHAKIIQNKNALTTYLQENNYATNIQIGNFELTSKMSIEEISNTIANQNESSRLGQS